MSQAGTESGNARQVDGGASRLREVEQGHVAYFRQHLAESGPEPSGDPLAGLFEDAPGRHTYTASADPSLKAVVVPFAALLLLRWMEYRDRAFGIGPRRLAMPWRRRRASDLDWSTWSRLEGPDLRRFFRRQLVPALQGMSGAAWAPDLKPLAMVLDSCDSIPAAHWTRLIRWVDAYDLTCASGRANAGEALRLLIENVTCRRLEYIADRAGEPKWMCRDQPGFATTRDLAELMVALLDPKPGGRIYDPCFGTGSLLATAVRAARSSGVGNASADQPQVPVDGVLGTEIDPYAYIVGAAQVALADASCHGLALGDALGRPTEGNGSVRGADYILAHPPWGKSHGPNGYVVAIARIASTSRKRRGFKGDRLNRMSDVAVRFLHHIAKSLKPDGRAVVAVHNSFLYGLWEDREFRRSLLTEYCVEGVVATPHGRLPLADDQAGDVSLLVFSRSKPASTVRFFAVPEDLRQTGDGYATFPAEQARAVQIASRFREGTPDDSLWHTSVEEIGRRDWDLTAQRTGHTALSRKLARLSNRGAAVETKPLGSVARVTMEHPLLSDLDNPEFGFDNPVVVDPVSVRDITNAGGVRKVRKRERGSLRYPGPGVREASKVVLPLSTGDVLLGAAEDDFGRVALVRDPGVATVAGYCVAAIRTSDSLSPAFLKCLLASDAYQDWLRGHARSFAEWLSVKKLRTLPVPIPPMRLQERVVSRVSGERGEPLARIIRILTDTHDPVVNWLEESAETRELNDLGNIPDVPALLDRIAGSVQALRDEIAGSDTATSPELARWLGRIAGPVAALRGLADVPPGPERMAILDGLSLQLERLTHPADPSSWEIDRAHEVTRQLVKLAGLERKRVLEDVRVEADIDPRSVALGGSGDMAQLRLTNRSPLPLRGVKASTHPVIGEAKTAYLAAGETLVVPIRVPPDVGSGLSNFSVRWDAARLDGSRTGDDIPLAVDVRKSRPADRVREIGASPYIVGNPVDRKDMLFGRDSAIDEICRQLRNDSTANVVLLEGNRRTGKTSILKRLQDPELLPDWITVNCSLQGGEGHSSKAGLPTNEVFRLLARDLGRAVAATGVQVWLPDEDAPAPGKPFRLAFARVLRRAFSGDRPFETFELFLQTAIEAARPRRILLMLDEFDKLQEGIDAGVTSPQVPENLRYLLHTYQELSAILAGSRRIKRLREEYWSALFGFGHRVPVSALPLKDARQLVTRPVDGRLVYVPEAMDLVVDICACQPFLIQTLCNRIFENAASSGRRTVTVDDVAAAATTMTEDNEHFRTLWGYAGTERRRFLLAICQKADGRQAMTLALLERSLRRHNVHLRRDERLEDDLEFLRELELIELWGARHAAAYRLSLPLMGRWIGRHVDFEVQRRRAVEECEEAARGQGYSAVWGGEA